MSDSADLSSLVHRARKGTATYHYCTAEGFWAILESKTLWLSSIWSLNDEKELAWGREMATRALAEDPTTLQEAFRFAVLSVFASANANVVPLVLSLSPRMVTS